MNMASVMMGWGAGVEEKGWRKGPWTPEEDKVLSELCMEREDGVLWLGVQVINQLSIHSSLNRSGKSCRLRWVNYLRPGLKRGHLTPQEEGIIMELHALLGNKWSTIARYLTGRTDNEIKNYWRTLFKKKDKCTEKQQKRKAQILKEKQQQQEEEAAESDMGSKKMKSAGPSTVPQKQDEVAACSEIQNVISDELQPAQVTRSMHVPLTCPIFEEIQCVPAALVSMSQLCSTTSTLESTLWSPDNNTTIKIGSENDQGLWGPLWNLEDDHHTGYNKCSNSAAVQLNQAIKAPFSGGMHSEATKANNISWGENIHPGNYFYGGSGYIF